MTDPLIIKAYQCPFCKKISRTIEGIKNHMHKCRNNDEEPRCRRCRWLLIENDFRGPSYYCCIKEEELKEEESSCQQFVFTSKEERKEALINKTIMENIK